MDTNILYTIINNKQVVIHSFSDKAPASSPDLIPPLLSHKRTHQTVGSFVLPDSVIQTLPMPAEEKIFHNFPIKRHPRT